MDVIRSIAIDLITIRWIPSTKDYTEWVLCYGIVDPRHKSTIQSKSLVIPVESRENVRDIDPMDWGNQTPLHRIYVSALSLDLRS